MENPDLFEVYGVEKPEEEPQQEAAAETAEETAEEKPKQSPEDNARFAAARRRAEAEFNKKLAAAEKAAADAAIKKAGNVNPYTKQPIQSMEDLEAYQAEHQKRVKEKFLKDSAMSEAEYNEMVNSLPEVKSAQKAKAEAEQIQNESKQAQMRQWVEQEIREVARINPDIQNADDLRNDEQYPQMLELLGRGYGIADAYKLTHFEELSAGKGRQEAINRQGKAHMSRTQARGEGSLTVPASVMRNYRALNPKATDKQIAEHYNRMMQAQE